MIDISRRSFLTICFATGIAPAIFVDGIARGILMPVKRLIVVSGNVYVGKMFAFAGQKNWFPSLTEALNAMGSTRAGQTIYVAHDHVEQNGLIIEGSHLQTEPLQIIGGTYNISKARPLQMIGNIEFQNAVFK